MLRLAGVVLGVSAAFGGGYHVSNLRHDSEQLQQLTVQQDIMQSYLDKEAEVAQVVQKQLSRLNVNERVIERERVRLVDRPIYKVECLDTEGISLLERYATQKEAEP